MVKRPAAACADDDVRGSPCKPARAKATPEKNSNGVDDVRSLDAPARTQGKRISIRQAAVGSVCDKTPQRRQRGSGRLDISLVRLPDPFDLQVIASERLPDPFNSARGCRKQRIQHARHTWHRAVS